MNRIKIKGTAGAILFILFAFPMGKAFIELFQHLRRLLSEICYLGLETLHSFALAVREAFIKLFQHFQRLLSLSYLPCPSGRLYDNTEKRKREIPMICG